MDRRPRGKVERKGVGAASNPLGGILPIIVSTRLQTNDSWIDGNQAASLFIAVGWGAREPEHLREAFAKSTFKCFAFGDAKLVGFGRTIDDGRYDATVVDRIVHPDDQKKGICTKIIQNLQNSMQGFLVTMRTAVPKVQPSTDGSVGGGSRQK